MDTAYLLINGLKLENFISYHIESNLFIADDSFSLVLANPQIAVSDGQRCQLYINGQRELNGLSDMVDKNYNKKAKKLIIEGRDLQGLIVDSYCEEFLTLEDIGLKDLAEQLLARVPFISREAIQYGKGNKIKVSDMEALWTEEAEKAQIKPGQTIFQVLKDFAMARGLIFFCMPDGTFIFSKPLTSGKASFTLINRLSGIGNNILEGGEVADSSQRYSTIKVIGQKQGSDLWDEDELSVQGTASDSDFPFYKPYVVVMDEDLEDPDQQANLILQKQRFNGYKLQYKTTGHSQNGVNWQTNAICHVIDEEFDIDGDFLIYERVFEKSKEAGTTTSLKLSRLGTMPE